MPNPNPSPLREECVERINHSKVKVEEKGRKAVFRNPGKAEVLKIRIDDCLMKGEGLKADFVVSMPGVVDVIVELKGQDVPHARNQIVATLSFWRAYPPFSPKIAGLIVCSRSPLASSELQIIKAKVLIRYKLWLEVDESGRKEYDFSNFGPSR